MTELVKEIYRNPEILVNMNNQLVERAKSEVEEIINKYDCAVKKAKSEWEKDYTTNSNGNEWYWSEKFETFNNIYLAKGVWDQILVCINAKLSGKWN